MARILGQGTGRRVRRGLLERNKGPAVHEADNLHSKWQSGALHSGAPQGPQASCTVPEFHGGSQFYELLWGEINLIHPPLSIARGWAGRQAVGVSKKTQVP